MDSQLSLNLTHTPIYIPVFRYRQEEKKVFTSFDFGDSIFPYIEIFRELERLPPKQKDSKRTRSTKIKLTKTFHEIYLPVLESIKSPRIFVDLPVHLKQSRKMKPEVLEFLRRVVSNRVVRTEYMKRLSPIGEKLIPVISTYSKVTAEPNSIILQERDLRSFYNTIAFRTAVGTFNNDMIQVEKVAKKQDFLVVDFEDFGPINDFDLLEPVIDRIKGFDKCKLVILYSSVKNSIKNIEIVSDDRLDLDTSLIDIFAKLGGDCFSDYAGIKRDNIEGGGKISPGFIFYDAVENCFYGYRGNDKPELSDFEKIIVPSALKSAAAKRMKTSGRDYLGPGNKGWKMLEDISKGTEAGKSQGKFKRIAMEHYLHCIRVKINSGDISI